MISLRRLIDGVSGAEGVAAPACSQLLATTLHSIASRSPGVEPLAREDLSDRFDEWRRRAFAKDEPGSNHLESLRVILDGHWDQVAEHTERRSQALAEIVGLFAQAAGKASASHREFYDRVQTTVRSIAEVGEIEDIQALRVSLRSQLSSLSTAVESQRKAEAEHQSMLESSISEARGHVEVFTKLVHSDPLALLPSATHGRERIAEYVDEQRAFTTATITLGGLDLVERRFDKGLADRLWGRFCSRIQRALPAEVHLYRWSPRLMAAITDQERREPFVNALEGLRDDLRRDPLRDPEMTRTIALDPVYQVDQHPAGTGLSEVLASIDPAGENGVGAATPEPGVGDAG